MSRVELIRKCKTFLAAHYSGDWDAAFRHYSGDGTGRLGMTQLIHFLTDVGVGNDWSRWAWGRAIIAAADENDDGAIDEGEFRKAIAVRGK